MMKLPQILIITIISITKCECDAKGNVDITRAKTYYPPSFKNYYHSTSYGPPFVEHGNPISSSPIPTFSHTSGSYLPTGGSFSQTGGGFSQTGGSYSHTGGGFSQTGGFSQAGRSFSARERQGFAQQARGNFRPSNENFLHVTSPGFQTPIVPVFTTDTRHQVVSHNIPVVFGTTVDEDNLDKEWKAFKILFNKTYSSHEEDRQRREIFIENRNKIAKFNQEYGTGRHTFVQKMSQYGDMLNHEFSGLINGFNRTSSNDATPKPERKNSAYIAAANVNLPVHVDWRELGAVSPVKRQGMCGACYAFSAAGAIEGQTFRKTSRLVELSPQNLVDCTKSYSNKGCASGVMEYAYEYVRDNRGIDREEFYPYEGSDTPECRYRHEGYGAHDTGYVLLDEGDEKGLEAAVATQGPVSVAIDAHPESFQFYSNGIYYDSECTTDKLNHGVLVVGYGTEPDGQQYWLVKNSYGPEWGIGGYMKLPKFYNNHCGIASYATYPLV